MTKADIIENVYVKLGGFSKKESAELVDLVFETMKETLALGEKIVIESLIGSRFSGRVVEDTEFGPHRAVVPEVEGRAHITGRHEFVLDPDDQLRHGFMLR